jgi:hypothetical protein
MRIVFGWNHFRIKSFDPVELGLTQQPDPNLRIEVRQHYFHFFRIPFFSLGKKWAIRKNNELYEMPLVLRSAIQCLDDIRVRTPWYTFAGPLLLLLIGCGFAVSQQVEKYKWKQREEKQFAAVNAQNMALFRKPSPNDYYVLTSVNGYAQRYAKVTALDKQRIQLSYITNPRASASQPVKLVRLFTRYAHETKSITFNRGDSAKLFCSRYEDRNSFAGFYLSDGQTYRVKKIFRLEGN